MATVSATEFARLFDLTSQRVSDLIQQGLPGGPPGRRGRPRQIDVRVAHDWLVSKACAKVRTPDGGESLEAAELRLRRASADFAEVKALEARNKVVSMEEVLALIDRMMTMAGSQIDSLAGRLASRVASESDPAACRALIFAEGRAIREAMSNEFAALAEREAAAGPLDAPEPPADA